MKYLENLTEEQRKIVLNSDGPTVVLAGAGSGKTLVLTSRVAHCIEKKQVSPSRILVVTFTNKASREAKERLYRYLGPKLSGLWIGTFHSVSLRILRKYAKKIGYDSNLSVYDRDDQKHVLRGILGNTTESIPYLLHRISRIKMGLVQLRDEREKEVMELYNRELKKQNALDFDDILLKTLRLLEEFPEVRKKYAEKFLYILVDEFQDTNRVQYVLLKHLSVRHKNLFVVGDDDQSIYTFRGSDLMNIFNFKEDFPRAKLFKLTRNFRSTKTILRSASQVVSMNKMRSPKELFTENEEGEPIYVIESQDEQEEAKKVVEIIKKENLDFRDFLVLYRTNAQSRSLEEEFVRQNIPYKVVGGEHFFDRKEIKDILSYLWWTVNPKDYMSFKRIINVPPRGIGKRRLKYLEKIAENEGKHIEDILYRAERYKRIPGSTAKALKEFISLLNDLRLGAKKNGVYSLVKTVIDKIDYYKYLNSISSSPQEAESRKENVKELLMSCKEFDSDKVGGGNLVHYLSTVSLQTDTDEYDESKGRVHLLTIHNAKGLESRCVIITGFEKDIFPHKAAAGSPIDLEEERRLCHVALTRAKKKVYILYARSRFQRGKGFLEPSQFLYEMPEDALKWDKKPDTLPSMSFFRGDYVWHPKFGRGVIKDIYDGKAKILFSVGVRTIVLEYVKGMKKI